MPRIKKSAEKPVDARLEPGMYEGTPQSHYAARERAGKEIQPIQTGVVAKFRITGVPVIKKNGRSTFVNKRTGQMFPGKDKRLVMAERDGLVEICEWKSDHEHFDGILFPIRGEVNAKFSFFLPDLRSRDLSNLYQLYEDLLETAGVLENDSHIGGHDGSRKYIDRDDPRIEIEITQLPRC